MQGAAAQALSGIIELPVCISAPTKTITEDHLDDLLLDRIKTIRKACVEGRHVPLENGVDKPVPLESHVAQPNV